METTEDVYYAETTEIIDEDGCWGMQEAVIVDNENLNWQEEGPEITVNYSETGEDPDQTIAESEVYLSTNVEDSVDNDKSQYYSILETTYQAEGDSYEDNLSASIIVGINNEHESILPDISEPMLPGMHNNHHQNILPEINEPMLPEMHESILPNMHETELQEMNIKSENKEHNDESLSNHVVLYHSEDPNEMYAIQIADDGSGNLQRFKYRVRQTADGQLEAIPGTIEVQDPNIEDEHIGKKVMTTEVVAQDDMTAVQEVDQIFQETHLEAEHIEEEQISAEEHYPEEHLEEDSYSLPEQCEVLIDESDNNVTTQYQEQVKMENIYSVNEESKVTEENFDASESYLDEEYGTPEYLHSDDNYDEDTGQDYVVMSPNPADSGLKLQKNYTIEEIEYADGKELMLKEKEDTYEYTTKFNQTPLITKRKFFKSKINSPLHVYDEHISEDKEITIFKDDNNISYLVVDTKEKENVSVSQMKTYGVKNARSILKSNCLVPIEEQKTNVKKGGSVRMLNNNKGIITKEKEMPKPLEREETKVPVVKIAAKSERQPRKQTIKPVERVGSEIIVQPMFYCYHNDNSEFIVRKKRKYTYRYSQEIVKVSDDSDPDYTEKPKPKKKKIVNRRNSKHKKIAQITIVDSDVASDEESVIEVLSDAEVEEEPATEPKQNSETLVQQNEYKQPEDDDMDKSDDLAKIQEAVDSIVQEREQAEKIRSEKLLIEQEKKEETKISNSSPSKKSNIKCPLCPKTFPRQINLKTHMSVHNARKVLRSRASLSKIDNKKDSKKVLNEKTAPTKNLPKKAESFNCSECKLKFLSMNQLARHNIIHNKNNLSRQSVISNKKFQKPPNISPKKLGTTLKKLSSPVKRATRSSVATKTTAEKKTVKQPLNKPFKCELCSKSFSHRVLLTSHRATHRLFHCANCGVEFTTKIHLDEHLRKNCVKKTVIKTPVRHSLKGRPTVPKTFKCATCQLSFSTSADFLEHQTNAHKKNTRTSLIQKAKPKKAHGGIQASSRMQRAFDLMKLKS